MQQIPIRLRIAALAVLLAIGAQPLALAVEAARQYTVRPGDTLSAISLTVGVPLAQLAALNGLADPDRILAGQTLLLPDGAAPAGAGTPRGGYTVRPGDSLSKIAASLGLALAALIEANNLSDPDRLVVGQKLAIPGAAPGGTAAVESGPLEPATEVGSILSEAAKRNQVEASLVKALAWYLSGWRTDVVSPTGAVGLMQITSSAQEWVGSTLLRRTVDRGDPRDNVEIGVAYLAYLIGKIGDERQGVAAYLQGSAGLARDGITPSTARALETIYGSRARFSGAMGPAAAAARPAAGPGGADLRSAVLAAARGVSPEARLGVAARNLATGERLDIRSGEVFPSASVNKVAILAEALRQISSGKLSRTPALSSDLERMIVSSDNEAANRVLSTVGEDSVNASLVSLGLNGTLLRNYFSPSRGPLDSGFNQTTPSDMAALFTLMANDKLVNAAASQEMRGYLSKAVDTTKLVRGVPAGTRVAHKSGWYQGVANDAGIVYGPRGAYVLAVFSEGVPEAETGNQLVAAVSRAVYDGWGS